jgi:hypothetical protein
MLARHFYTTLLAGLIASSAFSSPAHARKRARAARTEAARAKEKPAPKGSSKASTNTTATPSTSAEQTSESAAPTSAAGTEPPAGEAAPRTSAPAPPKARVYSFSGLDVNGNLKAPQLLFFRGRVKQELDTSNPEKRSFLKELERTADAKGL